MNKSEYPTEVPSLEYSLTLDFIARNILYLERTHPGEKEVTMENIMIRLGGTRGEIDNISHIKILKHKKTSQAAGGN